MTVAFVAAASAEATSLSTMPTHEKGDLLIAIAGRTNDATVPSAASGWNVSRVQQGGTSPARTILIGWKVAASAAETSGTWANAQILMVAVYRDSSTVHVCHGHNGVQTLNSTTVNYATLQGYTTNASTIKLTNPSAVVFAAILIHENTGVGAAAPSTMTNRANFAGATNRYLAIHDTGSAVSSFSAATVTAASAINAMSATIELCDTGYAKSSGGFRPVNIRGGADQ